MSGLQQKLVSFTVALALGAICFVAVRWVFATALTVGHKPQGPITIARVFAAPDSSWSGKVPSQGYQWGLVGGTEPESVLRFRSLERNSFPEGVSAFFGTFSALGPALGIAGDDADVRAKLEKMIGSRGVSVPPLAKLLPHMKLKLPTEMKTTEDQPVEAEMVLLDSILTPEMSASPTLLGTKAAFDITGPFRPDNLSWKWNVQALTIGDRRTLTLEFPPSAKFDFRVESSPSERLTIKGNVVTASVDIRDELGLTQAQRTGGIVLASIISALGTIFAYPFVKGRLEPKPLPPPKKSVGKKRRH